MIKTPKFDTALDTYFSKLKLDENGGQWRVCRFSGEKFYVRPEDIAFYRKIRVPLPTLSPHERARRKLAYSNIYNLFHTKSAFSGKTLISSYPPATPYRIYEHEVWKGGGWDPEEFAVTYDKNRGFFEQYAVFQRAVPRPNLFIRNSVESDYTNYVSHVKNCYLIFDAMESEDSAYCIYLHYSKNCYDSLGPVKSDICYDCVLSENLYRAFFVEYSRDCLDSFFLYDCRDCQYCFASTNLRHKKYYFLNEQLGKEEYETRLKEINLGDRNVTEEWKKKFSDLKKEAIHKANRNERSINCTGDHIRDSRNCYSCFFVNASENIAYSIGGLKNKDSYDLVGGNGSEFSYDTWGLSAYNTKFSMNADFLRDCEYCDLCENCSNCFACIGLKNRSFCIFNKQYDEEEYWSIVDAIKTNMFQTKEYGEFFPPALCPVPYNISLATSYQGYDDVKRALLYGYCAEELPEGAQNTEGEMINATDVPSDIKNTTDDILGKVIFDEKNNRKFRYTKKELDFHRQHDLALPTEHYSVRLARKRIEVGPIDFGIKTRSCSRCGEETQVSFPKDHLNAPKIVYCEKCYNSEIV